MRRVLEWATAYEGGKGWTKVVSYLKKGEPAGARGTRGMKDPDTRALDHMAEILPDFDALDDEGRRVLHAMAAIKAFDAIGTWLDKALAAEGPDQDIFGAVAAEVRGQGAGTRELLAPTSAVVRDGRPTSAGRALMTLSDDDLVWCLSRSDDSNLKAKLEFLLDASPDRMPPIIDRDLDPNDPWDWEVSHARDPARYAEVLAPKVPAVKNLRVPDTTPPGICIPPTPPDTVRSRWTPRRLMLETGLKWEHDAGRDELFGTEVREALITYLATPTRVLANQGLTFQKSSILHSACDILGREAIPVVLSRLRAEKAQPGQDWSTLLGHLIDLDDGTHAELIREELVEGLAKKQFDYEGTFPMLDLAARWGPERLAEPLWSLAHDPSKKVRDAVVPVLARLGDEAIRPRAVAMLVDSRKADRRRPWRCSRRWHARGPRRARDPPRPRDGRRRVAMRS